MLIKLYEQNTNLQTVRQVVDLLRQDAVIIIPTDTVYAFACSLSSSKAYDRMARIKGVKPEKADFSLICSDLSHIADYSKIDNATFKLMKKALPGPFTFILNATSNVPKLFRSNKKTIGIRVPDNNIALTIVQELGEPLVVTSVLDDDEVIEYTTDPELIEEKYTHLVEAVVDGGYGNNEASTIIDCTSGKPSLVREGIGKIEQFIW